MIIQRNVMNWLFDCNVVRKMEKFIMFSLKYLPKIVTECHTECWTAQVLWTHLRLKYRSLTLNTCYSDTCISKFIWF